MTIELDDIESRLTDALHRLAEAHVPAGHVAASAPAPRRRWPLLLTAAAVIAVVAAFVATRPDAPDGSLSIDAPTTVASSSPAPTEPLAVPAMRHLREAAPPRPQETRLEINTPATDSATSFALSPDGRQLVFAASGDGAQRLWFRSLDATAAQPLGGT